MTERINESRDQGPLPSEIPDSIGLVTSREKLVRVKTGGLIILTATMNDQFKRALVQSGVSAQEFFSQPEGDIEVHEASVEPNMIVRRIADTAGLSVATSVLEEAKTNAVSVLNGYAPEAGQIIDGLREEILVESKRGTFRPNSVNSSAEEIPSLADGQPTKNGDHWTKTTKSGLRRGPGSKRYQSGKHNGRGFGSRLGS